MESQTSALLRRRNLPAFLAPHPGGLRVRTGLQARRFCRDDTPSHIVPKGMPATAPAAVAAVAKPPGAPAARRRRGAGSAPPREAAKLPRVDIVFNPVSGHGNPDVERAQIREILAKGYHAVNFHETTPDVGAHELAWRALQDGASVVVASGGDGTVTEVADAIMKFVHGEMGKCEKVGIDGRGERAPRSASAPESPKVESERGDRTMPEGDHASGLPRLGVIPRGTANAFCAAMGIPASIEGSATLINRATARRVDLAKVNGRDPMLLLCGVGLEAEVVKKADRSFKNRFGAAAYAFAGMQSVAQQTTFNVELSLFGVRQRTRTGGREGAELTSAKVALTGEDVAAVTIANSAPATSVLAQGIGDVQPDDGLLEVVCVAPSGRFATITSMFTMLKSALLRQRGTSRPEIYGLRARRVEVKCDPPQKVVVDGEVAGVTPLVVELAEEPSERQILVVAPKAGAVTRKRRRLSRALVRGFRNARGLVVMFGLIWGIRFIRALQSDSRCAIAT